MNPLLKIFIGTGSGRYKLVKRFWYLVQEKKYHGSGRFDNNLFNLFHHWWFSDDPVLTTDCWLHCILAALRTHHLILGGGRGVAAREFFGEKIFCCTNQGKKKDLSCPTLDFCLFLSWPILEKKVCHASPVREKWAPDSKTKQHEFVGACSHEFLQFHTT